MTTPEIKAYLRQKDGRYIVELCWYQDKIRRRKSVSTGVLVDDSSEKKAEAAEKRAKKEMKLILSEWKDKVTGDFQDILFSDYLLQWLETAKHSIAETTYHSYKKTIERQICPYFAKLKIKLHELKPFHIEDFYTWKQDKGGVSANTIHHYHANISKALRKAYDLERIKSNPAKKVSLPKKDRFMADFYTAEEMRVLLDAVRGHKIETPVFLASWFGLRRGEALGLRYRDVNFTANTVSIRGVVTDKGSGSRTENVKYRKGTKTASGVRTLPLPLEAAEYLKRVRAQQAENRLLLGESYNLKWDGFICLDVTGDLIKPDYLSRTFPLVLKKHGLRKIRLHELRDSNASLLLANGVDLRMLQGWLGHAHYSTTEGYAHHRADSKMKLGGILSKELVTG